MLKAFLQAWAFSLMDLHDFAPIVEPQGPTVSQKASDQPEINWPIPKFN